MASINTTATSPTGRSRIDNNCGGQIDEGCVVPGDLDCDGIIDKNDVSIIKAHLNQQTSVCPECDIDGNGTINILDARKLVLRTFGNDSNENQATLFRTG